MTPELNVADAVRKAVLAGIVVGVAVLAYRHSAVVRTLADALHALTDNAAFVMGLPVAAAAARWWFRNVVWPSDPREDARRPGERG